MAKRRRRQSPYDVTNALGPIALRRLVNSLVKAETRPAVNAINRQETQTLNLGKSQVKGAEEAGSLQANRSTDYYAMLAKSMGQTLSGQQQAGSQYAGNIQGITDKTTTQIDQAENSRKEQLAQDAAVRGGGYQQNDAFEASIGAARVNAAQQGQDIKGLAASQNANYEGLLRAMTGSTAMKGGEIQGQIAGQTQAQVGTINSNVMQQMLELGGKKADVKASAGGLKAKYLTELRDSEFNKLATMEGLNMNRAELQERQRSNKVNENITVAGLQQDQLKQRATQKQDRAANNLAQQRIDSTIRQQNITIRGQDISHEDRKADRELREQLDKGGGVAGLTPYQLRKLHENNAKYRSSIRSVKDIIQSVLGTHEQHKTGTYGKNKPGDDHFDWANVKKDLNMKYKDADMIDAAFELWKYGWLSNDTEKRLKDRHIGVPKGWRVPPKGKELVRKKK